MSNLDKSDFDFLSEKLLDRTIELQRQNELLLEKIAHLEKLLVNHPDIVSFRL